MGEQTVYTQIQEIEDAMEPYEKLWSAAVKFHAYYEKWMNGPLLHVCLFLVHKLITQVLICYPLSYNSLIYDYALNPRRRSLHLLRGLLLRVERY